MLAWIILGKLPDSWSNRIFELVMYQAVQDHFADQYIDKLAALAGATPSRHSAIGDPA